MKIKNRVKELRQEKGLTMVDFAKALRISRQSVSAIEAYRFYPSIELAYKIAKYFGLTIEEVFIFEEE